MAKSSRAVAKKVLINQPSEELLTKINFLKQLINIHDLLNTGTFHGHLNKRIAEGLDVLTTLHKQLLEEVMTDEEAHLVPGLLNK